MIKIETKGFRELAQNLASIEDKLSRRIIRTAARTALVPAAQRIRAATYTTVKRRTGLLKAGLGVRGIRAPQGPGRIAAGVFAKQASAGFLRRAKAAGRLQTRALKSRAGRKRQGGKDRADITEPFYWRFIEFGTKRMSARPYVAAAFGSAAGDVLERFRRALASGIERAARERPHK